MATVPISLNDLSEHVKVQTLPTTPADVIAEAGKVINEAYKAYQELRELASLLGGLAESAPLPENVTIDEVTIRCRVNGAARVVKVHAVTRAGDLTRLLTREAERLVGVIRAQAAAAQENAETIQAACSRAQYVANAQGYRFE